MNNEMKQPVLGSRRWIIREIMFLLGVESVRTNTVNECIRLLERGGSAKLLRRQIRLALDLLRRNRRDSAKVVLANALKGYDEKIRQG